MPLICSDIDSYSINTDDDETVHLVVVACGDRLEEPQVMIKSAVLLTQAKLHVHIFADDQLRPLFKKQVSLFTYTIFNEGH